MTRLTAESLFDLTFLRDARLSPDGRRVAYAVSRTRGTERCEIWIVDLASYERRLMDYDGSATSPRWSPDGKWIAFVGDGRLRVATLPALETTPPLTPEHLFVQGAPTWSPDSRHVAVSLLDRRPIGEARRIAQRLFRADGLGLLEGITQRIFAIDVQQRTRRCLTPEAKFSSQPEWSPCGRYILFLASDDVIPFASYSPWLLTVTVSDGKIVEALGAGWYVTCARWLPGGERIAIAAARKSTLTIPTLSVWVVNRDGSDARLRTPGLVGNVGFHIHHDMPAWDLTSNALTVRDATSAFATIQKGGRVEVWRVALEGDVATESILSAERSFLVLDAHRAENLLLYAATDLSTPPELWLARSDRGSHERLTTLNDQVIARWPEITVDHFIFDSTDGTSIEAWFMASAGRNAPLPSVLFIHGGPFAATGYAFRYDFLLLASQGLGVVFANFRGSAGYGESFARAIMGDWGERGFPDHMGAVDAAISRGLADPNRLGVWGASHGGFATCWIVGHTRRFKAAVAEAAPCNFTTLYYLTDVPGAFERDLGGRPHEIPDVYRARSPLTYAHRCVTPTLLLHGEDDLRVPISEAEQFFRALQDVGCITELVRIPECSHLGDSLGPLSARRAQNQALTDWFLRHL